MTWMLRPYAMHPWAFMAELTIAAALSAGGDEGGENCAKLTQDLSLIMSLLSKKSNRLLKPERKRRTSISAAKFISFNILKAH